MVKGLKWFILSNLDLHGTFNAYYFSAMVNHIEEFTFSLVFIIASIQLFHPNMSPVMRKPVLPYANNKGADQPAHPRCLISPFVVRCLDSMIPLVSITKISRL